MANIKEILHVSGGSLQRAEQIALERATGDPRFWLDLALVLSVQGKFTGARQAQTRYLEKFPDCQRVRFGMAPFALMDGELQAGLNLLESGRGINCWGAHEFATSIPMWDGVKDISSKTLLLHAEGGVGDEMINLRAVKWIHEKGARCVAACTSELMMLARSTGADAVIDCRYANAVAADYWLPTMSAPRLFERTWKTLFPGPYLRADDRDVKIWKKIIPKVPGKLNIGLRWRGNPRFEHENLRRFPSEALFSATEIEGVNWYSLQKDAACDLPERIVDLEPFLSTWSQTAAAVAQMDLVVTSCTAIAHMAGAMGIPTWVIVPVLPYYVWAESGARSSWYPTVRLYRQECYGKWEEPFKSIKRDLEDLIHECHAKGH